MPHISFIEVDLVTKIIKTVINWYCGWDSRN